MFYAIWQYMIILWHWHIARITSSHKIYGLCGLKHHIVDIRDHVTRRDERTREDSATKPMNAGGWVSQKYHCMHARCHFPIENCWIEHKVCKYIRYIWKWVLYSILHLTSASVLLVLIDWARTALLINSCDEQDKDRLTLGMKKVTTDFFKIFFLIQPF